MFFFNVSIHSAPKYVLCNYLNLRGKTSSCYFLKKGSLLKSFQVGGSAVGTGGCSLVLGRSGPALRPRSPGSLHALRGLGLSGRRACPGPDSRRGRTRPTAAGAALRLPASLCKVFCVQVHRSFGVYSTYPLICLTPCPTPEYKVPENWKLRPHFPGCGPKPNTRQEPGKLHTNQSPSAPTPSERTTGHVAERGTIIESVLRPPREDSEVPWSRRGPFRPGRPRFCPSGGRAPAAPPQPVRESAAARAPAPGPRLPRPSLSGRVLAAPRVSGGI